jgi:acetylornithine deacetylase/succinyl-diaminopimelate desuccinylase-like protein
VERWFVPLPPQLLILTEKGAMNLGIWLEEKYGKDSVAMLVDEGSNMEFLWGQLYATPAVAEKGMLDVEIRVETAGGHSSVPRKSPFLLLKDNRR